MKLITFGHGPFIHSQKQFADHLSSIIDIKQHHHTSDDLGIGFKNKFKDFLKYKRGYGYCIWKPYLILKELNKLGENDVLLYIDSTDRVEAEFFKAIKSHLNNNNNLFLNRGFQHSHWTKRDTFVLMDCDTEHFYNQTQLEAGVIIVRKNKENTDLISEWFDNCSNPDILLDKPNVCGLPNLPGFREHRYDQSILTNIIAKRNINSFNFPDQLIKYNYYQPEVY